MFYYKCCSILKVTLHRWATPKQLIPNLTNFYPFVINCKFQIYELLIGDNTFQGQLIETKRDPMYLCVSNLAQLISYLLIDAC